MAEVMEEFLVEAKLYGGRSATTCSFAAVRWFITQTRRAEPRASLVQDGSCRCRRCGHVRCDIAQHLRQAFRNDRIIPAFRPFVHVCHKPIEDAPLFAFGISPTRY
jgi:hypothetical protein